jgi:hypothetical protein
MSAQMTSIQSEMRKAREDFQTRLFAVFDEYRDAITERNAGYLKKLHEELTKRNIKVLYVRLSIFVNRYREENEIPMRNKRLEKRT